MSRGHKFHDILWTYTSEQVFEFQSAALVNYKNLFKEFAIAVRIATTAKEKGFKEFIQEPLQRRKKRKATKEDASKLKKAFGWLLRKK